MTFDVPASAKIYVAYDANASSAPTWLSAGYTNTNLTISTSNPLVPVMDLWVSNSVTGTQTLPAANAAGHGASSNYLLIVVEE